uniref:Uncharacterized protein n=1 Tax=Moniliophthora roreri TaxID=221103 RepID=A0A0W0G9P7_MONRR
MSNATASSSSSSASGSQLTRVPSPVPTVSGEGSYGKNITYQHGLQPNPYQLLHLFNSGHLLTQLTSEPQTFVERLASALCAATEPPADDTLVYPDPTPDPDIKPKVESTDNTPD